MGFGDRWLDVFGIVVWDRIGCWFGGDRDRWLEAPATWKRLFGIDHELQSVFLAGDSPFYVAELGLWVWTGGSFFVAG